MTHWIELMNQENTRFEPLDWLSDELEVEIDDQDPVHVPLGEWVPYHSSVSFLIETSTDGARVHLSNQSPTDSARDFWRTAVSVKGLVTLGEDGAAVVEPEGKLVVMFRDGSWDTVGGYAPTDREHAFWSEVAALFTTVPSWFLGPA